MSNSRFKTPVLEPSTTHMSEVFSEKCIIYVNFHVKSLMGLDSTRCGTSHSLRQGSKHDFLGNSAPCAHECSMSAPRYTGIDDKSRAQTLTDGLPPEYFAMVRDVSVSEQLCVLDVSEVFFESEK